MIKVSYRACDGYAKTRSFKTLDGARKFAQKYVGETPEISEMFGYAVSADGVGKVTVEGATLTDLFPASASTQDQGEEKYGLGYMQGRGAA